MLAANEPARLAHLEPYLIDEVGRHFRETGELAAEDFWLILIWKANRAKNNERRRFEKLGECTFEEAVTRIARALFEARSPKDRLGILMRGWKMKLATASAVSTILYPEDFTVYDVRVCDQLGSFHTLKDRRFTGRLWADYQHFVEAVINATPAHLNLRQKDHFLWGQSLRDDVRAELRAPAPQRNPQTLKTIP